MTTIADYFDALESVDFVYLNAIKSPGVVTVKGHDRTFKWDVKSAPYQIGATTHYRGQDPASLTLTFYLVRDDSLGIDQISDWDTNFEPVLWKSVQGKTPKAMILYHPDIASRAIGSVVVAKIGGKEWDGKGGCKIELGLLEYKPPRKAGGTPKGATKKDPDQDLLDQINALTNQYQKTPWT